VIPEKFNPRIILQVTMFGKKINIGGSVYNKNGVINFDKVDGDLTNYINSIPAEDPKGNKTEDVKKNLSALKAAILSENDIPNDVKEDALHQVSKLVEAAQTNDEAQRKLKANMAFSSLNALNNGLGSAAKLASSLKVLLPLIGAFFGL
jgi:hypothetical protein